MIGLAKNHKWYDAYDDPILRKVMIKKFPRLEEAFQDIKTKQKKKRGRERSTNTFSIMY